MKLGSARLFLNLILALSFTPTIAFAHDRSRCEQFLVVEPRKTQISPWWFQSHTRNKLLTALNRQRLREVKVPAVRHQCLGTCYYQAAHASIESELRGMKVLAPDELLSGFVNQMKIAWLRNKAKKKKVFNFQKLLTSGNYEGFGALLKGSNFIVEAKDIQAMHGSQYVSDLEEYLFSKDNPESVVNYDENKTKGLLNLPFDQYVEVVREIEEEAFAKAAKQRVCFRSFKVKDIRLNAIEANEYEQEGRVISQMYLELSQTDAFRMSSMPFELARILKVSDPRSIFADIAQKIDAGQAVKVGLSHIYKLTKADTNHAVALVGYYLNSDGKIDGFKFVNSWGRNRHAGGFGYITVDQLYTYFLAIESIEEIKLDKS